MAGPQTFRSAATAPAACVSLAVVVALGGCTTTTHYAVDPSGGPAQLAAAAACMQTCDARRQGPGYHECLEACPGVEEESGPCGPAAPDAGAPCRERTRDETGKGIGGVLLLGLAVAAVVGAVQSAAD